MKRHILLLISILIGALSVFASEPATSTNKEAATFFSKASMMDSTLILVGKEKYAVADKAVQTEMIKYMLDLSNTNRAIVEYDGKSWFWYFFDGHLYCNSWNTSYNLINDYNYAEVDRLGDDKWFFTVGGDMSFSSVINIGISGRFGTYLWKRYLDAGLGLNCSYSNSSESDNWSLSMNITSRLYFTRFFSNHSLAPFVGAGFGYVFSPSSDFDPLVTLGLNWYLPKGSIDVAIQYGKSSEFGLTAGYTISF